MVKKLMYISPVGYNTYDNEIENYLLKYAENCTICATSLSKALIIWNTCTTPL